MKNVMMAAGVATLALAAGAALAQPPAPPPATRRAS